MIDGDGKCVWGEWPNNSGKPNKLQYFSVYSKFCMQFYIKLDLTIFIEVSKIKYEVNICLGVLSPLIIISFFMTNLSQSDQFFIINEYLTKNYFIGNKEIVLSR